MSDLAELCRELAGLYRALGSAAAPIPPGRAGCEPPDPSNQIRPALLWCATHSAPHRRDEWETGVCAPGQDPRRASVLVAPALTGTAPRWSQARKAYGSRPPLDMAALVAQEAIWVAAAEFAEDLRYRLGFGDRPQDGLRALGALPGLVDALPGSELPARWVQVGVERLRDARRGARLVLDIDGRRIYLGDCPEVRQPYPVAWTPDGQEATTWQEGECWTYDAEASTKATPADGDPVDVWVRSRLYVRDRRADPDSPDGLVRCTAGSACRTWDRRQRLRLAAHLDIT